jgi:DNA-binding IclR family transcriptional regulator
MAIGDVAPEQAPANQSIERAARLLSFFSVEQPELTLAELTARLGTSRATTHRYLTALRRAGLVRQARGVYALGPRVVELAASALAGLHIVKIAGPFLERLTAGAGETAVLSVWDGEQPVVVRVQETSGRLVRISVPTGSRLPADSAQGRVFRAHLQPDDPTLDDVRRDGTAAAIVGVVEGIDALAAPVFQGDEIVATMALVGTSAAIDTDPAGAMAATLRTTAAALSAELGFLRREGRSG